MLRLHHSGASPDDLVIADQVIGIPLPVAVAFENQKTDAALASDEGSDPLALIHQPQLRQIPQHLADRQGIDGELLRKLIHPRQFPQIDAAVDAFDDLLLNPGGLGPASRLS